MKYPAFTVSHADGELVLAVVDDFSPTAAEQRHADSLTVYFRDGDARDRAADAVARAFPDARLTSREVDDEDWARRSQRDLQAVTVGRLTIYPGPSISGGTALSIVIQPSMGFGTGHHATTRLCLAALQAIDVKDASVLDVGTGSGVLAIAACRLGARSAIGIDNDPDAIQAARENLGLNADVGGVAFEIVDLTSADALSVASGFSRTSPVASGFSRTFRADIVVANLTGALLAREAGRLLAAVKPGGRLIVSGLLDAERDAVRAAFAPAEEVWEAREDEWVALVFGSREGRQG